MNKIADSVVRLPASKNEGDFIKLWLTFLTPLHKLTPNLINLASEIVRKRIELSRVISDDNVLDKYLFSDEDVRKEIMENCGMSKNNYYVGITNLKKAGFIVNGKVNPKLIPTISKDATSFSTLLMFSIKRDETD
jgi:hypothetical protein